MNAIAALRELVACKDLKESIEPPNFEPDLVKRNLVRDEYGRRKERAWAAARAVLADRDAPVAPRSLFLPWTPEETARRFHEAYEHFAPMFGYKTREASAKPWADVPEQNKALMIATIRQVFIEQIPNAGVAKEVDAAGLSPADAGSTPTPGTPTDEQLTVLIARLREAATAIALCHLMETRHGETQDLAVIALTDLRTHAEQQDIEREIMIAANHAQQDTLAAAEARAKALHEAVRGIVIVVTPVGPGDFWYECRLCNGGSWHGIEPQRHRADCLAAPLAKPVEPSQEPAK